MLRKRSRPVTSPQAIVGDHSNNNNNNSWLPPEKSTKPTSFFLNSPKFFKGFFTSCSSSCHSSTVHDPIMSPTSILDTKAFSAFANTFWVLDNSSNTNNNSKNLKTLSANPQHSWEQPNNTKGIGLALIDDNNTTSNNNNNSNYETGNTTNNNSNSTNNNTTSKQHRRKLVVFGSQLRIQVPPLPPSSVFPCFSPESPREFGIKTPKNSLWPFGNKDSQVHPQESSDNRNGMISGSDSLSLSDMELSEDYTCVISHGPNPKTTHIFGNCIVQSCCGVVGSSSISSTRNGHFSKFGNSIPSSENFLSFCHHCKKKLDEGNDIYMYRGEKAFCSQECRCQAMLLDEVEN